MDVPISLLYIFYAVLQIYIYFSVGMIAYIKKITSSKMISEIIFNYFLPIYSIVELARMATWKNIEIMWILVITVLVAIFIGFALAKLVYRLFDLDCRMTNSFPYLVSIQSLGTLPLVMGRALCYPGGMLEGDPYCDSILGFMIMNSLVFFILLFVMGFTILPQDANLTNSSSEKLSYVWHHLIPKLFDRDYTIYSMFKKYMKDIKTAEKMYSVFNKKYKLEVEEGDLLVYKLRKDPDVKLEFNVDEHFSKFVERNPLYLGRYSEVKEMVLIDNDKDKCKDNQEHNNHHYDNYFNNSIIEENSSENPANAQTSSKQQNHVSVKVDNKEMDDPDINRIKQEEDMEDKVLETFHNLKEKESKKLEFSRSHKSLHRSQHEENVSYAVNYVLENKEIEVIEEIQKKMSLKEIAKLRTSTLRKLSTLEKKSNDIERYYILAFLFVERDIKEDKVLLFNEEQEKIFKHLKEFPPKFPIVKNKELNSQKMKIIDDEYSEFEKKIKKTNENFTLKPKFFKISFSTILVKILSPPIVCCFLGLLIGMSDMREILFSKNHYIANVVEGLYVVTRATVPFLYVTLGISMISVKNINYSNTPISTKYVLVSFIVRFVMLPGIGLLYVYLWKTYFGGIVAFSKVFKFSMFIPFCLPSAATVVVVVNMLDILKEETSLILFVHNTTLLITLTVWYLIYFLLVGS